MTGRRVDNGQRLFRLVYASRAVVPVLPRFDATVAEIVEQSQANNERMGLTGLLLAHQGWFVQVLEGPRRNVSLAFGAIGRDLRHAQIELLGADQVQDRLFGQWRMCARSLGSAPEAVLDALDLAEDFDPFRLDGDQAVELLSAISKAPADELRKAG